jgi:transglutaminase-like putative cysteine protease
MRCDPVVPIHGYRDGFGNWCNRLVAPAGRVTISALGVVRDGGELDPSCNEAVQHQLQLLPEEVLVFLLGSRYCETDRLSETAWRLFGTTPPGAARVQAVCDYVHRHIQFGYEHASATKTAWEVFNEPRGVCRDFTHLAIALLRALNIPTRYCTGYLGDIGLPPPYAPMDFAAWLEVYLGGAWHTFDPRNNVPRRGRILIARGRDAADVAIATTFGPCELVGFKVVTDEIPGAV